MEIIKSIDRTSKSSTKKKVLLSNKYAHIETEIFNDSIWVIGKTFERLTSMFSPSSKHKEFFMTSVRLFIWSTIEQQKWTTLHWPIGNILQRHEGKT